MGTHDPSPTQGFGGFFEIFLLKGKACQYFLCFGLEIKSFIFGKFFLSFEPLLAFRILVFTQNF